MAKTTTDIPEPAGKATPWGGRYFTDVQAYAVIEALGPVEASNRLGERFTQKQRDMLFEMLFGGLDSRPEDEDWILCHKREIRLRRGIEDGGQDDHRHSPYCKRCNPDAPLPPIQVYHRTYLSFINNSPEHPQHKEVRQWAARTGWKPLHGSDPHPAKDWKVDEDGRWWRARGASAKWVWPIPPARAGESVE
jgi:hypothetical protein